MPIAIDINKIDEITSSANYAQIMDSFRNLVAWGAHLQIVAEYENAPTERLFTIRTREELDRWQIANFPRELPPNPNYPQ